MIEPAQVAFGDLCDRVLVEDFNWNDLEAEVAEIPSADCGLAAQALAALITWAYSSRSALAGTRKLVTLMHIIKPEVFNEKDMVQLAATLGTSKQSLSIHAAHFRDSIGLKFSYGRGNDSREEMRKAMIKSWRGRRGGTPPTPPGMKATKAELGVSKFPNP